MTSRHRSTKKAITISRHPSKLEEQNVIITYTRITNNQTYDTSMHRSVSQTQHACTQIALQAENSAADWQQKR